VSAEVAVPLLAVAGAAAAAGLAFRWGDDISKDVEQLGRIGTTTGASIGALQTWRQVIKEAGGDFGGINQALFYFSRQVAEGNPAAVQLAGGAKNMDIAFMNAAATLSAMTDTGQRNTLMQAAMGRQSRQLAADFGELVSKTGEVQKAANLAGSAYDPGVVEKAKTLDAETDVLGRNWANLWEHMKIVAVPAATIITKVLDDILIRLRLVSQTPLQINVDALSKVNQKLDELRERGENIAAHPFLSGLIGTTDLAQLDSKIAKLEEQRNALQVMIDAQKGGFTGPPIPPPVLPGSKDDVSDLDKEIQKLQTDLGLTADSARAVALAMQAFAKVEEIKAVLKFTPAGDVFVADFGRLIGAIEREAEDNPIQINMKAETAKDFVKRVFQAPENTGFLKDQPVAPKPQLLPMDEARQNFKNFLDATTADANVFSDLVFTTFDALSNGIANAFSTLLFDAKNFGDALKSLFKSLVNAVLQELARLAAASIFRLLLGLVTGGAGAGAGGLISGAIGGVQQASVAPVGGGAAAMMAAQPSTTYNVSINAVDARSAYDQFVSPRGAFRNAQTRMVELASVS
jgi:hypothetical protein